ncbi:MAG: FAD/NAD(P)-binding oxidoreductase [Actinomycetota bacterium]
MAARAVVVLGGGTGGLVAARRLRRELPPGDRVVVVERDPVYRFAPSFLWVLAGTRRPAQVCVDIRGMSRRGIEVAVTAAEGVDLARGEVATRDGRLPYDRLVVALGAELAPAALPGFAEAAHNLYTLQGAEAAGRALVTLERGRVAVLVSRLPYKCPAAPYEAAFLAEALLRRRGVRDRVTVDVFTPEPYPMPTAGERIGREVAGLLASRGIGFHPGVEAEGVDAARREILLPGGGRAGFDVLIGVPPHRAPSLVAECGLAAPGGFVPVDRHTLATAADGVFALGDVTAIPVAGGRFLPKAGVFAHAQAEVVARRVASELAGRGTGAAFDGTGACFLEVGDGAAGYASGDFYAEDGPRVRMRRPGRHWHLGKVAFERQWMWRLRRWGVRPAPSPGPG